MYYSNLFFPPFNCVCSILYYMRLLHYMMEKKVRQSLTILVCLGLFCIISFFLYSLFNDDYPATPKNHSLIKTTTNAPAIINHLFLTAIEKQMIHPTQSPNSFYKKEPCMNRVCINFLDTNDSSHFSYCWRKSKLNHEPNRSVCRFLNASDRVPVALASFPGSGNTWVRGLLQAATGVCTGAIHCDTTLRRSGFPGESVRSGKTLVIKTHQTDPNYPPKHFEKRADIPVYSSAIFIIRNPLNALVVEWNRLMISNNSDNHILSVEESYFSEYVSSYCSEYVSLLIVCEVQ